MRVLVTGGAGYIGSGVVDALVTRGDEVVIIDDLSRGHRDAVHPRAELVHGSVGDDRLVTDVVASARPEAAMHFAGYIAVGESVRDPGLYFERNVAQSIRLLNTLRHAGVDRLVFSSSAAVYGTPDETPIPEDHPTRPESPYGWTKLAFEQMLAYSDAAYGFRSASLRYFNAAGATAQCREAHDPETHLIPLILDAAQGRRQHIEVFGNDYPTPDGTAIRDYIHVVDLAEAHLSALDHLVAGGDTMALNLGTGRGYSVLEVIETTERVIGDSVPWRFGPRRPGDPPVLVAGVERAAAVLGWQPRHSELEHIIATAWEARK